MNDLNNFLRKSTFKILLIRGITIAFGFLLVPLTYNYLGNYGYGIWATIFSFANWINLMDVGISNGLRNDLTKSLETDDFHHSRRLVSTGYISLGVITVLLIVVVVLISEVFNIGYILDRESSVNLSALLLLSLLLMLSNLYVKLIHSVFYAIHKPQWIFIVNLLSNTLIYVTLFAYRPLLNEVGGLYLVSGIFLGTPILVYLIVSFIFLKKLNLMPTLRDYSKSHLTGILNTSSQFFIIQMAVVIVNTSDTFIINTLFSPKVTANFSILNKYASVILILTTTFFTPLWALYTKAHMERRYSWIRKIIIRQRFATLIVVLACIGLILLSGPFFRIWIGESFTFSYATLITLFAIVIAHYWANIHAIYLNGLGELKLQTRTALISILVNIPLSIYLGKNYGVTGVLIATVVSISIFGVFGAVEVNRKLRRYGD